MNTLRIRQTSIMFPLHPMRPYETLIRTKRKRLFPLSRMPVHITPQLHLPQSVLGPLLKRPHIHILHIMLNQEHIQLQLRLIIPVLPIPFILRLLIQRRLKIKIKEKPSPPHTIKPFRRLLPTFRHTNLRLGLIMLRT
ncbi:hypothetical protein HanIR_Chr08g0359581 [Helianthus annuus]|nr:hypothetical protein HanIR_Chr08g0359581 [Helianthus annuus]